jgi:outer membrane protein TolC
LPALVLLLPAGAAAQASGRHHPAALPAPAADGTIPLTLAEAVFIALRDNRAIRSEYLQRVADRFALRVAESAFDPRLNIAGGVSHSRPPAGTRGTTVTLGPVVTLATVTGAQFTFSWLNTQSNRRGQPGQASSGLGVNVIQPLLAGGGIDVATAPLRIARISEASAKLRLRDAVAEQVTQVVLAYRTLVQTQEGLRISRDSQRRARDLLEVNRVLIAAGRLAEVELVQSEAALAQQELGVTGAESANETARLTLLLLLGVDPATRLRAAERPSAPAATVNVAQAVRLAEALQPGYLSRRLALEVSRINLDLARNSRLWDVSIVAGAGQQAARADLFRTLDALSAARADFNIGLQVNIPIGNPSREQIEVNAGVLLRQNEIAMEQARDQLRAAVEDAVRQVDAQRRQAEVARRARELSNAQLQAELAKLQAGRSSNFQVVSFQATLASAESAELSAVVAYANALTRLDRAVGTTLETWRIRLNDE